MGIENSQEQFSLAWLRSHIYSVFAPDPFTVAEEWMVLISWTWDISPTLEAGTGSTPLTPQRLGVGERFPPKGRRKMHRRQKKIIHLSTTVNCNYNLLFPQHNYPISEYNSVSINERRTWRLSHIKQHCCLRIRNVACLSSVLSGKVTSRPSKQNWSNTHPCMHSFIHVTLVSPYSEIGPELGTEATKINKAAP